MLVSVQVRDDVALKIAFRYRATGLLRDESLIIRCLSVLSVSLLKLVIDVFLFISVSQLTDFSFSCIKSKCLTIVDCIGRCRHVSTFLVVTVVSAHIWREHRGGVVAPIAEAQLLEPLSGVRLTHGDGL